MKYYYFIGGPYNDMVKTKQNILSDRINPDDSYFRFNTANNIYKILKIKNKTTKIKITQIFVHEEVLDSFVSETSRIIYANQ